MSRILAAPPIIRRVAPAQRVSARRIARALAAPVRTPVRVLAILWVLGLTLVGGVAAAHADDGFIIGPDLGGSLPPTVFERIPTSAYTVPFGLSDSETGFPYVIETMWNALRVLCNVVLFLILYLIRGALTGIEWLYSLTFYQDNAAQLDSVVQGLASKVYWPLAAITFGVGAIKLLALYDRERSILGELAWLLVGGLIAIMFITTPSSVAGVIDNTRIALTNAAVAGFSAGTQKVKVDNAAGFEPYESPGELGGPDAVRVLNDSLWNTFAVTPWCYVAWGSMEVCRDVGKDYLENTDRWKQLYEEQRGMNADGDVAEAAKCPEAYQATCAWVRGQAFGREGALLFVVVLAVPFVVLIFGLALFGLMALIGFALLVIVGGGFALLMVIRGTCRAIASKFWAAFIGTSLQGVIITLLLGGVMTLSSILALRLPTYGFFTVAILNIALLVVAWRFRSLLENITGAGAGGGGSFGGMYMGMQVTRGLGRMAKNTALTGGRAAGLGGRLGYRGLQGGFNQVLNPGSATNRGARALGNAARGLSSYAHIPTAPPAPRKMATATPWRPGADQAPGGQLPAGASSAPRPITAKPTASRALPSAPSTPAADYRGATTATASGTRPATPVAPVAGAGRLARPTPGSALAVRQPDPRVQKHGVYANSAGTPYAGGTTRRDVASRPAGPARQPRPLTSRNRPAPAGDVIDGKVG